LLPLIGELADTPELPLELDSKLTAAQRGQFVLAALKRRAEAASADDPDGGAACLLMLDNVSEPSLRSQSQLIHLPRERFNWLRVVATTRLGRDSLYAPNAKTLDFVPVNALDEEDVLQLLREHQDGERWPCPEDEEHAREIVRELAGFTLAIEQVAIHLGLHLDMQPRAYFTQLRRERLPSADALGKDPQVAYQMLHQDKQFATVLASVWESLSDLERTTLEFACLLPPESIPWPFLYMAVKTELPEALAFDPDTDTTDPWNACRRRLEGRRLITPGAHPELGRLHRLAGAFLRQQQDADNWLPSGERCTKW